MTIIQTIIMGIVEGVTEFLPISSTGHLILADFLLKIPATEFIKSFNIAIQLGAILAVVILYAKKLLVDWRLLARVVTAFMPTAVLGLVFYKIIKTYLLGSPTVVVTSLLIGGVAILAVEYYLKRKEAREKRKGEGEENPEKVFSDLEKVSVGKKELAVMTYREAVIIGLAQSVAMIPGVSRSAATIIGGLLLNFSRSAIVEFSFLLAIPTMLAATVLDLYKSSAVFNGEEWSQLVIGFVVSFIVALAAIKWLLIYIQRHNFNLFGIYRIAIAIIFLFLLF